MRPEAFKKVDFELPEKNTPSNAMTLESLSYTLLYINLFCLIFFSVSVLFTHQRILDFFQGAHKELPHITYVLLSTSSYEYMTVFIVAGIMLIMKERSTNKKISLVYNVGALFMIWFAIFFYVWGMSLPFGH